MFNFTPPNTNSPEPAPNEENWTEMHYAAASGDVETIERLYKTNPNLINQVAITYIIHASKKTSVKNIAMCDFKTTLNESEAKWYGNHITSIYETPIHIAIRMHQDNVLSKLLELGGEINKKILFDTQNLNAFRKVDFIHPLLWSVIFDNALSAASQIQGMQKTEIENNLPSGMTGQTLFKIALKRQNALLLELLNHVLLSPKYDLLKISISTSRVFKHYKGDALNYTIEHYPENISVIKTLISIGFKPNLQQIKHAINSKNPALLTALLEGPVDNNLLEQLEEKTMHLISDGEVELLLPLLTKFGFLMLYTSEKNAITKKTTLEDEFGKNLSEEERAKRTKALFDALSNWFFQFSDEEKSETITSLLENYSFSTSPILLLTILNEAINRKENKVLAMLSEAMAQLDRSTLKNNDHFLIMQNEVQKALVFSIIDIEVQKISFNNETYKTTLNGNTLDDFLDKIKKNMGCLTEDIEIETAPDTLERIKAIRGLAYYELAHFIILNANSNEKYILEALKAALHSNDKNLMRSIAIMLMQIRFQQNKIKCDVKSTFQSCLDENDKIVKLFEDRKNIDSFENCLEKLEIAIESHMQEARIRDIEEKNRLIAEENRLLLTKYQALLAQNTKENDNEKKKEDPENDNEKKKEDSTEPNPKKRKLNEQ